MILRRLWSPFARFSTDAKNMQKRYVTLMISMCIQMCVYVRACVSASLSLGCSLSCERAYVGVRGYVYVPAGIRALASVRWFACAHGLVLVLLSLCWLAYLLTSMFVLSFIFVYVSLVCALRPRLYLRLCMAANTIAGLCSRA